MITIAASVILVVGFGLGARGLLLGNYGASTLVLARRCGGRCADGCSPAGAERRDRCRSLLRFGLPTVPAEASVYALQHRRSLLHLSTTAGSGLAGLYSIAIKLAGAVAFIVRAFQYAWPPLAYSVRDDAEAARLYGLVTTYYC